MGLGAASFARAYGNARYISAKGQTIAAYDPRSLKVNGVTYLTSPMGADHTAGNGLFLPLDHPNPEGKVNESYKCQVVSGWVDALGLCTFLRTAHFTDPTAVPDALKARFGGEWPQARLDEMGRETLRTEVSFNRKAGLPDVSSFPDFVLNEPLPPLNTVWEINEEELQNIWAPLFAEG
jgi:aldehyde:ferredoxin oxidoreductase